MGTSRNALALAQKLRTMSLSIPEASTAGLVKAAAIVEASVAEASGRYRGHKIVRTRAEIAPPPVSEALVKMVSRKAHLLDHDTHYPQESRHRDLQPSRPFAARQGVRTHGKLIWEHGVEVARPLVMAAMSDAFSDTLQKVFGG